MNLQFCSGEGSTCKPSRAEAPGHGCKLSAPDCGTASAPGSLRAAAPHGQPPSGRPAEAASHREGESMAPRIERAPRWRGAQPPPSATPLTSTLCSSIASGSRRGPRRPSESVVCAVRRRPEVARSSAPTSAGSRNSATSVPHPVRFPAGYPPFRHFFIRAPALGRRGRASGSRSAFLPPQPPASVRLGSLGPRDGGARVWNRRGPGPRQNRRCGGFANTNGNQGS